MRTDCLLRVSQSLTAWSYEPLSQRSLPCPPIGIGMAGG